MSDGEMADSEEPTTPPIVIDHVTPAEPTETTEPPPPKVPLAKGRGRRQRKPPKEQKEKKPRAPRTKATKGASGKGATVIKSVSANVEHAKEDLRLFYLYEMQTKGLTREMVKQKIDALNRLPDQEILFEADCYRVEQQGQNTNHLSRIARDTVSKVADHLVKGEGHVEKAFQADPAFGETLSSLLDGASVKLPTPAKLGIALVANMFKGILDKRRANPPLPVLQKLETKENKVEYI